MNFLSNFESVNIGDMETPPTIMEKRRRQSWIIHMLAFLVLFTIPFFLNPRHSPLSLWDYIPFMVPMIAFVAVFYINYFILIRKFLYKRKILMYVIINLIIIGIFAAALYFWGEYYFSTFIAPQADNGRMHHAPWYGRVIRDVFFMVIAAIISIAVRMTSEWYRAERERAKIEAIASQAELKNLKSQLNPHFLFNTLNNIYSLMRVDSGKAQNAILELSKILRYVLGGENQEKVLLKDDVAFMKNYIELMSLRLTKNVTLTIDIPSFEDSCETIAPLLFISLVENAFKHGISQTESSFIDVSMYLEGSTLSCRVRNSYFPKGENDRSGSGIGIDNLKKRLSLLYPGKHTFSASMENNIYTAKLEIICR